MHSLYSRQNFRNDFNNSHPCISSNLIDCRWNLWIWSASSLWLWRIVRQREVVVVLLLRCIWLFVTPWSVGHQGPLFPRQEYWNGLPFPSPGDLPNPKIEPASPALASRCFTTKPLGKPISTYIIQLCYINISLKKLYLFAF